MRLRTSLLLWCAVAATAVAQNNDGADADEIVTRAIQARGGANKLSAIGSMKATGTIRLGGNAPGPLLVYMKRPSYFRVEMQMGAARVTQGFDGVTGWQMTEGEPAQPPAKLTGAALNRLIEQASNAIDGPLLDFRARNIRVALAGHANANGRDCLLLRVTLPTGGEIDQYLDASTYLEIHEELPAVSIQQNISGYKPYAGVLFPSLYESDGQRLELTDRQINPKLDASIFAMPSR